LAWENLGKLVAVRGVAVGSAADHISVTRFNGDGSRDRGFGEGGTATLPGKRRVTGAAVQPDGKTLISGYSLGASGVTYQGQVIRLRENGTLDPGFGADGVVPTPEGADSLTLQPDRKILIGGGYTSRNDLPVTRLNPGGGLDGSFGGGDGVATLGDRGYAATRGIAIAVTASAGRIIVGGYVDSCGTRDCDTDAGLARSPPVSQTRALATKDLPA
jgi:uncharacterized delta-60 repeat protein